MATATDSKPYQQRGFTVNIKQHFSTIAAQAAEQGKNANEVISQRERLFNEKIVPALVAKKANDVAIKQARTEWYKQTDQVMQSAGLIPKAGQSSASFEKDKRAERAIKKSAETGSKLPIIGETILSTAENIGNTFGQGVGSTIEGLAGFVRDIGENETDSIAARTAEYGKNLKKGYEASASTLQKEIQAGKHGKIPQLASGAVQSVPAMALPMGAARGAAVGAAKLGATAAAPYIGLGVGAVAGHTQNYGEVRRNATENLERDFPTWQHLQGNPVYEAEFNKYLQSGMDINQAKVQAHKTALDLISENAADKYGAMMTGLDFIAPSGAVLGSGILKKAPTSKVGKILAGGEVSSELVKRQMAQAPRVGMAKLAPDLSLAANKAALGMVGKQALEEGLQGAIGEYGGQAASAKIGGQSVQWGDVGKAFLEEAAIGGIMGGGMQYASRATPIDQAKSVATDLRNQTNRLRQEEAAARKELSEAIQLGDQDAINSATTNLGNIATEAAKVKSAYEQYGVDVPYFVNRFAEQAAIQPTQQDQPEQVEQSTPEQQVQPAQPQQQQPTPQAQPKSVNIGMADTTNLVMDSVSKGKITPDEASEIQSNPILADVFRLSVTGDEVAAHNVVMNAVSLGNITPDQAQSMIQAIPRYKQLDKPSLSGIVNNHVQQQVQQSLQPQDDLFSGATELDPETFEPIQQEQSGIIPDDPNLTDFGYQPKQNNKPAPNDPNLRDFGIDVPEAIEPVAPVPNQAQPEEQAADFSQPKTFSNYIRANDFLKSNNLQDSHEIIKRGEGLITVQPKSIQSAAPQTPVAQQAEQNQAQIEPVQPTTTPAEQASVNDFASDEAFDSLLNAVPPINTPKTTPEAPQAKLVEPITPEPSKEFTFAEKIKDAHISNPKIKPQLINEEVAKGRPRSEVLKEVADIVKAANAGTPSPQPTITPVEQQPLQPKSEQAFQQTQQQAEQGIEAWKTATASNLPNPYSENELRVRARALNSVHKTPETFNDVVKRDFPNLYARGVELAKTATTTPTGRRGNTRLTELSFKGDDSYVSGDSWSKKPTPSEVLQQAIWHLSQQDQNNAPLAANQNQDQELEQDIGRASDNAPFANESAANMALKKKGLESSHEVIKLQPSQFILRKKSADSAPVADQQLDLTDPNKLVKALIEKGRTEYSTGEPISNPIDVVFNYKYKKANTHEYLGQILQLNDAAEIVRKLDSEINLGFDYVSGGSIKLGSTGYKFKFAMKHSGVKKLVISPLRNGDFKITATIDDNSKKLTHLKLVEDTQEAPKADTLVFPLDKVKEAYSHAHLSPANTARSFKESFDRFIQSEIDEAQPLATTDEQKAALKDAIDWVKDTYINKLLPPLLSAASATVSSARAGRNNFNSKQANQRGSALDKATSQFDAELERLKGYAKLKVLAARTPEQKQVDDAAEAKAKKEKEEAEQAKVEAALKAQEEAKANKKRASNEWITHPDSAERMTMEQWKAIGKDYKGITDGVRRHMGVPVWITDEGQTKSKADSDRLKVGDTITFSEVFDYALPNQPYKVITSTKTKITLEGENGGQFSFKPNILNIEKGKNPDIYTVAAQEVTPVATPETPAQDNTVKTFEQIHEHYNSVVERLENGAEDLTIDEVKQAYSDLMQHRAEIEAGYSSQTKQQLLDAMNPYMAQRAKSDTKASIVERWVNNEYRKMDFSEGGMIRMSFGEKRSTPEIVQEKIEKATQDDLNKYLEERRKAKAEREAEKKAYEAGLNDPKTVDDFNNLYQKSEHYKFIDFYRSLPIAQQALYDELKADQVNEQLLMERERQKAHQEAQRPSQAVSATTGATLYAGKHTKKGHDIWTVHLTDRVERDTYTEYNSKAKELGGYYSSYRGGGAVTGFVFSDEATAQEFLNYVTGEHDAAAENTGNEVAEVADPQAEVEVFDTDAKTHADKLRQKAQAVIDRGEENLNRDRKTNTHKRAGEAARAEEAANRQIFLGETLNNIADAIENGSSKHLRKISALTQLREIESILQLAANEQQNITKAKEKQINASTIGYAEYPQYKFRTDTISYILSDLRKAKPSLAAKLESAIDDHQQRNYEKWLFEKNEFGAENYLSVIGHTNTGSIALFKTSKQKAEAMTKRANAGLDTPKFYTLKLKNGEYAVVSSYQRAIESGDWKPTVDNKQIILKQDFGDEIYDALKAYSLKDKNYSINWLIERDHTLTKRMRALDIYSPANFRAMLREYLSMRSAEKGTDPIKEMERSMIGRVKDGLDFFPTPRNVVEQMIDLADLNPEMKVLEPSAGMGHIADILKEYGVKPDVVELSGKRQDLLKLKGYSVVGNDFLMFNPENRSPNFGDEFKTKDGQYQGIMRGSGSLGSERVRLVDADGKHVTYASRDELELVKKNGTKYDRIVMNPPFSDRRDAEHIYHAHELLADDGVLVSIAGEGVFTGSDKKAKQFQDWLDAVGAEVIDLEAGVFNDPNLPVTTGVKSRIIKVKKADSKGKKFSIYSDISKSDTDVQGSTPEQVRSELVNRFGDDVISQLEENGTLNIIPSYAEKGIEGFAENGQVTLVADAITADNIVPVFLHELGGHIGMQGVMKPQAYNNLMAEFNRLVKTGNPEALQAKKLAERESGAEVQADEYLPYLITVAAQAQQNTNPAARLVNRILSAVKAWVVDKLGLNLKLNPSDLVALAERMVKTVAKNPPPTPPKGRNKSQSIINTVDRPNQTETAAFKKWFGSSKVVDENGKPIIMYHGTPKSFNQFNTNESGALLGRGSYFTAQVSDATAYAGGNKPMQTYLSIQNPYYVNSVMEQIPSRQKLKELGHDGVILLNEDKSIKWAVAHNPSQIKSATANNGTFDSNNPDIRYSRSSAANPQNMSRSKQREFLDTAAKTAFGGMALRRAEGAKTLSKRTLNLFQTMLHKSLTDETGEFKKTFDLVQDKINHVTFTSAKSMDVAPSVLTQLETGADYVKEVKRVGRALGNTFTGGTLGKAKIDLDIEKVGNLMFENTLQDQSKRHSEAELKKLGFDDDQIGIYNEIRSAIDSSLDTFANTTFSNIYKHLGGTTEEVLELAARDLDIHEHYKEIMSRVIDMVKNDPKKAEAGKAAAEGINRVYNKANDLKAEGYVPLMRFGKYFIRVFNPATGEVAYRQHYESESERNIEFDKQKLDEANLPAGYVLEKSQLNELEYKLFQGVSPETVALFAKESGLPIGDAEAAYIKHSLKNNHALKRLLKRQGIKGFDTDIKRVLASFVLSNSRYSANQTYNPAIDESITEISNPAYQEDAVRLRDYSLDTQEELAGVKNFAFVYYMGFSAMFGLVNLTQPFLQTLPYLMQYSKDYGITAKSFMKAIQTWRKGTNHIELKYKDYYERARREGHLDPQNTWMLQGLERGKSGLGASTWQLISHSSGLFAQASETVNRRTSLFAALDVAESLGQAKLEKLGFKDAYDFAVRTIQETQGIYNKGNRPRVARGNVGSILMMYKQFMIAYIEQMVRMQKSGLFGGEDDEFKKKMAGLVGFGISRSVLVALGILFSLSGTTGLPFVRDILDGIETAGGLMGKPVNTEREIQIALQDALGQTLGSTVNKALMDGFVNLQPVVDVKGRMGMGDLIPATAYFSPTTSQYQKSSEVAQIGGAIGGLIEKVRESVELAQVGSYGMAGVQLLPKAATSFGQGLVAATTGDYRNMKTGVKTNDATVLDGVVKMLDAQPAGIAEQGRIRGLEMRDRAAQQSVNARWKERYVQALESGDRKQVMTVKQQIREYNRDNPRYPITFNQKTAETNFNKSNQSWQEKRKNTKGLEWMDDYNPHI